MSADVGSGELEPSDTNNYATWAVRMKALLGIKELWDVVDCGLPVHASLAEHKKDQRTRAYVALNLADHHLTKMICRRRLCGILSRKRIKLSRQRGGCCFVTS
jgi:hypothetical protein